MKNSSCFFRKILAFTLIVTFVFPNIAFANSSKVTSYVKNEEGVQKNILNLSSDVKLISWENENEMVFDQYDGNNKLVDHVVYKKGKQTATSYSEEDGSTVFTIDLPKETSSSSTHKSISLKSAASKMVVDTVVAENTITSVTKKMYVYQDSESYDTDYVLPSKGMSVAKYVASVAIGVGVSVSIANILVGACVSAGICILADKMISSFGVKVRATRYEMTYYGKDKQTSKKSSNYKGGRKYKVTSSGYNLNEEYTEGLVYSDSESGIRIAEMLAQNLYGTDFHVYE